MQTVSLGISPCPNDVYIFSGILLGKIPTEGVCFDVNFQDIETLNHRAIDGTLDVVKISYANAPRCMGQYDLLSCGGALGRGVGPLLLSNGGTWDPTQEILVPGEFTTANFLLDHFVQKPLKKRYMPFDALYEHLCQTPGAQGVVIHEKRFTFAQDGLSLIQDLGEYWEQKTGYAIPLGAIVARKELGMTAQLEAWIRASLTWADAHYTEAFALCRDYAQDLTDGVIEAHIKLYVNAFSHDLGAEGQAAVAYLLEQQKK